VHRAMSEVSLYWSNTVVVAVYDLMLLAGLGVLFRLVYRDAFTEAAAWIFTGMSTALLTFLALSAFNVQAYATLVAGLVACELVLQSRRRAGLALLAAAFVCISQAYPLTFFLPLFCLVWTAARVMMALAHDDVDATAILREARAIVAAVIACVLVVEAFSFGTYFEKAFGVVFDPFVKYDKEAALDLPARVADLVRQMFWPDGSAPSPWPGSGRSPGPGFAPYFVWVALALVAVASAFLGRERRPGSGSVASAIRVPGFVRPWLPVAAWAGLIVFGYLPAMFGTSLKSQRTVPGDLFLAMAVAHAIGWMIRRGAHRGAIAAVLVVLLGLSDLFYARAFLAQDHTDLHAPVFDYDVADGIARHDIDVSLDYMREQIRGKDAAVLVYYPSGRFENTTDPTMFYARFLRRIGSWQRSRWILPCRFCNPRYGCPHPEVAKRACGRTCCYFDPVKTLEASAALADRRLYVWWFEDPDLADTPRRNRVLARLKARYRVKDLGTPAPERRWSVFELTPRDAGSGRDAARGAVRDAGRNAARDAGKQKQKAPAPPKAKPDGQSRPAPKLVPAPADTTK
jgi:hypothetical protein